MLIASPRLASTARAGSLCFSAAFAWLSQLSLALLVTQQLPQEASGAEALGYNVILVPSVCSPGTVRSLSSLLGRAAFFPKYS